MKILPSLAVKYRPATFSDLTEQSTICEILENITNSDPIPVRNFLFVGPAGCGKAQPLYSKVLTPDGYVEMRDIHIGSEVFTGKGNVGKVSGVYPQGVRPIYEITLQDRTKIRVSDQHLNVCYRYNEDKKCREDFTLTTLELIDLFESSRFKLRIDIPKVDWNSVDLPIDPYLLGALIGDGSLSNNFGFSNSEEDVIDKVDSILRRDWNKCLKKVPGDNFDYQIVNVNFVSHKYTFLYKGEVYNSTYAIQAKLLEEGYPKFDSETIININNPCVDSTILKQYPELTDAIEMKLNSEYKSWTEADEFNQILTELGLFCKSVDKHIPKVYLNSSYAQRLELLRGLYDTDGYTDKSGSTCFTTCSDRLSDDFSYLVRSLGIRDTISNYPAKYKVNGQYKYTGSTAHDHNLKFPNDMCYCSSEKHVARRRIRQNDPMRNIVSIEYVGDEECQCIMVDHPDHTYISDGFIPTHNTTLGRALAHKLNHNDSNIIEVDAASNNGVDSVRQLISQMQTYPVGSKYKIFILDECHAFSQAAWQIFLKVLEDVPANTINVFCTTNPEKIPATILSRVQTFQLSKISLSGITNRLKYVLDSEISEGKDIRYDMDAVGYIAKLANGGMRDALTLLDKALTYSNDISLENISKSLNIPNYDDYFDLLNACAKKDNVNITRIVNNVYNSGVNFVSWFTGFHSFIINIMKYIFLQDIKETMIPSYYEDKISKYSVKHSAVCLKLASKVLKMNNELKTAVYLQEVALTYLCS